MKFELNAYDRSIGAGVSEVLGTVSGEILVGVGTGGLSQASKLGKAAAIVDVLGNGYQVGSGISDIRQNGLSWQNSVQVAGAALGVAGNLSGASRALDEAAEAAVVTKVADDAPTGEFAKPWKAKIEGTAQKTGTPGHQFRTYREAIKEAKKADVEKVHLNHGYNRALDLDPKTIGPNRRPDVTSVYADKSVLRIEIQSKTDLPAILRSRNSAHDLQLIEQGFLPLPPRVIRPNSPSVSFRG